VVDTPCVAPRLGTAGAVWPSRAALTPHLVCQEAWGATRFEGRAMGYAVVIHPHCAACDAVGEFAEMLEPHSGIQVHRGAWW
jgi:hypothetical protein